jgi:hypothetical protein
VLDHLDDLASDFSAIHRVDDMLALDGPTFMRLAYRIGCYQGVLQVAVRAEGAQGAAQPQPQSQQPLYGAPSRTMHGGSRAELQAVPEFSGIFSFSQTG